MCMRKQCGLRRALLAGRFRAAISLCSIMSSENGAYLPFRGLSAWFSSSVRPCMAKMWDKFGGCFSTEGDADFLFSDSSYSEDTVRVYDTQASVTVFQSAWLSEVVRKRCTVHDVPLGQHLVLPHYLVQVCLTGDPFKTPEPVALMQLHREGEGGGVGSTSLSQLLAHRERRKDSQLSRGSSGRNNTFKNSRECLGSLRGSCTEAASLAGRRGLGETEGGAKASEGGEREGARDVIAVWNKLLQSLRTASLNDIQHINTVDLLDWKLMDFDPSLSQFTMRRK